MKNSTRIICLFFVVLGALNFGSSMILNQQLGGDAVSGRQANGHFYVSVHGKEVEVSQQQWNFNHWQKSSLILTWPLFVGAMFLLIFKHELPKELFRGDATRRARTVREIRTSGSAIMQVGCEGKIGQVRFSEGFLKVTIYPKGLVCQLRLISEFGITVAEIESVEKQTSLLNPKISIVHCSPNVISPILLRCTENKLATQSLLSLGNRNIP